MPYQFIKLDVVSPRSVYLRLNRNYKSLGYSGPRGSSPFVEYGDCAHQAVVFSRDPHSFVGVWPDPDRLYLYNDDERTQIDYFDWLGKLMPRSAKIYNACDAIARSIM